jgi:hypothetical protein
MIAHRTVQPCRGCHQIMDPIGLALENFDGVGRWRTANRASPSTPRSARRRHRGEQSADAETALLTYPDAFEQTLTEKLLMYAVGRVSALLPTCRSCARLSRRGARRIIVSRRSCSGS